MVTTVSIQFFLLGLSRFWNNPHKSLHLVFQCDVIVNTTNKDLDLSSGEISKDILRDAGPKLQEEFKTIQNLPLDEVAVTNGYNLPCKTVFHIFLPHWSESSEQVSMNSTRDIL